MACCEKCWFEARRRAMFGGGSIHDHYYKVMREVQESGEVCTPEEQAGPYWDSERKVDTRFETREDSRETQENSGHSD
jgi:hypothetical protein